jgi:methylmalonyl-CoA/ethylmalonyl-CoA epimerase
MFTKVSHVGVVVRDIEDALEAYTNMLGLDKPVQRMDLPELGFKNAMLKIGDFGIELMETASADPNNEFNRFLDRHGEGVYHLCVIVDDLEAQIKSLKAKGAEVLEVPPSPAMRLNRAFVKRRSAKGVLIEMIDQREFNLLSDDH